MNDDFLQNLTALEYEQSMKKMYGNKQTTF